MKVADALSRIVRGRGLSGRAKPEASSAVHYGFGAAMGVTYGILAATTRVATVGWGMGFGAAVWLGAHVIMVPALGLAPSPLRQPLPKGGIGAGDACPLWRDRSSRAAGRPPTRERISSITIVARAQHRGVGRVVD